MYTLFLINMNASSSIIGPVYGWLGAKIYHLDLMKVKDKSYKQDFLINNQGNCVLGLSGIARELLEESLSTD